MKEAIIEIAKFLGIMAIPLMLATIALYRSWNHRLAAADQADFDNDDYLVSSARQVTPAAWPNEFEQEPRGM